ncbi:septal ring lytic transglycosylase RlpA family protein [Kaarinaea lacus]
MNDRRPLFLPGITRCLLTGWVCTALLSGCGGLAVNQDGAPDETLEWENIPDASPRIEPLSKTGNPTSYVVNGQRYYITMDTQNFAENGIASWYGTKFHGNLTSSGEPYDMYKMTAAHKSLPLPSYVSVTNLENDKQVIVKVNDRGPFVDGRIIDLSYAAAQKLGVVRNGTAEVSIKVIAAPTINGITTNGDKNLTGTNSHPRKYFVQLGAFSELDNAEKFRDQLTLQSIEPTVIKTLSDTNGELHKVQVGPLVSINDLQLMESRLIDLGYTQTYIITE